MKLFGIFYCAAALTYKNSNFLILIFFQQLLLTAHFFEFLQEFQYHVCILKECFARSVLYSITQLLLSCHHWLGSTWDTGTFPSFSHAIHFPCVLKSPCLEKRCCTKAGGAQGLQLLERHCCTTWVGLPYFHPELQKKMMYLVQYLQRRALGAHVCGNVGLCTCHAGLLCAFRGPPCP